MYRANGPFVETKHRDFDGKPTQYYEVLSSSVELKEKEMGP